MKLNARADVHILGTLQRKLPQFKSRFKEFASALVWFDSPACPVGSGSVKHSLSPTEDTVTIEFEGIIIAFRLTKLITTEPGSGGPRILVLCTLENPMFGDDKPLLGRFTFDQHGLTDFDADHVMAVPEMNENAADIAVVFLALAASRAPV